MAIETFAVFAERIKGLRAEAREYQRKKNMLVSRLWDIDFELLKKTDAVEIEALTAERLTLIHDLESNDYETKFQQSIQAIREAVSLLPPAENDEQRSLVEECTRIGGSSPYRL